MKKYLLAMVLVVTSTIIVQAQRILPKQKGFEINAGSLLGINSEGNYYLSAGITINAKNGNYQLWALEYHHQYYKYKQLQIPHETFTAEGGYSFFLSGDARRNITLNAALTGVIGYESINRSEMLLYDGAKILNEDSFIYGAGGRLSLETYLSDHLVLLIQGRIKAFWRTGMEQIRPSAGAGLRFNF